MSCDVRVVDGGARPKLLQRFGFCREDRFDSAVLGLWLGRKTIVEEIIISPSPHGEAYQLWSGPVGGTLHQIGGEWGWTDSDEPPTFGCDRMVAAGAGALAITPVVNNAGDGTSCATHTTTPVLLRGSLNRRLDVPGAWGALATNGKRIALAGFDSEGRRTSQLAVIGIDGRRLSSPQLRRQRHPDRVPRVVHARRLFLDTRRGLVGPGSRLLVGGYDDVTIAEGRAVYCAAASCACGDSRRPGPARPEAPSCRRLCRRRVPGGRGTDRNRKQSQRALPLPWRTIDAVLPRAD